MNTNQTDLISVRRLMNPSRRQTTDGYPLGYRRPSVAHLNVKPLKVILV
jgi:hypothetical protein